MNTKLQQLIADCLEVDAGGRLVQRRDHLNLAGLGLTDADLRGSFTPGVRNLPEISLASLRQLRYLDLTGNQLEVVPHWVGDFTELVWLGLNFNRLARLPHQLGKLHKLQRLYLRGNALQELPREMGSLAALVELDLTGNPIPALPSTMGGLKGLEHLALDEGGLAPDLRSTWKEKGWPSLREYLKRLDSAAAKHTLVTQYLSKVILIGAQENGKTCLQRALRDLPFETNLPSTPGMSRERLHLSLAGDFIDAEERARRRGPQADIIDLTLWDMGGQESYQHTLQLFFSPGAVYLLVLRPRAGGGPQLIDQWIELVRRRTDGKATIIVVFTCCASLKPDETITLAGLKAKYGGMIHSIQPVDSKDGTGIADLRKLIAGLVTQPKSNCQHRWLPGWAGVLDELSRLDEAFLRWNQVRELCAKHGLKDDAQQRQLVRAGHFIGALLWREDLPAGEDVVILNPDWLCRAVARLLDDQETGSRHGLIEKRDLPRVWSQPGRDGVEGYPKESHEALIQLMEINELAYRPRDPRARVGEGELLLVTQMVGEQPEVLLEREWERAKPKNAVEVKRAVLFRKTNGVGFEKVPDIIFLLIFRLREFSLGRKDYKKAVHWRKGLVVQDDHGAAARIELVEETLRITVCHRLGDGLMHSIIHRIGVSDDGFWNGRGLEKEEYVPCGAACPNRTPDAGLISIQDCVEADRVEDKYVKCEQCRKRVPIADLLNAKPPVPVELQTIVDAVVQGVEDVVEKEGAATRQVLSQALAQMQAVWSQQMNAILDAFTSEWKDGPRLFSIVPLESQTLKDLVELRIRIVVWCEATRRPVPLFKLLKPTKPGSDAKPEFRGSVEITLTREWLQSVRKWLVRGSWLAGALHFVPGAIGALVNHAGEIISQEDKVSFEKELAAQQKSFKELAEKIPDESKNLLQGKVPAGGAGGAGKAEEFGDVYHLGFGKPEEADLKLIRHLREEFKKKDLTWGGLKPQDDGKFQRIWAIPGGGGGAGARD